MTLSLRRPALALLLVAAPALADPGRVVLSPRSGAEVLVDAVRTEVRITVSGVVQRATVRQVFENPSREWMEATYLFPLPEDAAVHRLRMTVGDRVIEGEVREREEARRQYEAAREEGARAALVQQQRPNLFTTFVANVPPGEEIAVEIDYQSVLKLRDGRAELRFPLAVTPRYARGAGDAAAIGAPVASAASGTVDLAVALDAGVGIERVETLSHAAEAEVLVPDATRAVVSLRGVPADRDFVLEWRILPQDVPRAAAFVEKDELGSHVLLLLVPPPAPPPEARGARDVVFILDVSGSMAGASMEQAREALATAVERLEPQARFDVVAFNDVAWSLWDAPRAADGEAKAEAAEWVRALQAGGGTEMAGALGMAFDRLGGADEGRLRQVVFLTDGAVGNEEELFRLVTERLGDARLFTVGIGSSPNAHFMSQAARAGRGASVSIGSPDEIAPRMSELFTMLESAVLTDVEVEWPDGAEADAWPRALPDLHAGEPLLLSASLPDAQGWVRISGRRAGREWSEQVDLSAASPGEGLAVLWARAKIDGLMDGLRHGAAEADVRLQVLDVALAHHVVSRWTSLVAVERATARPDGEPLASRQVALARPAGSAPCLPACATSWRRDAAGGLLLSLVALLMLRRRA